MIKIPRGGKGEDEVNDVPIDEESITSGGNVEG
jgi:hypothetical protein